MTMNRTGWLCPKSNSMDFVHSHWWPRLFCSMHHTIMQTYPRLILYCMVQANTRYDTSTVIGKRVADDWLIDLSEYKVKPIEMKTARATTYLPPPTLPQSLHWHQPHCLRILVRYVDQLTWPMAAMWPHMPWYSRWANDVIHSGSVVLSMST